ncbi:hypothetical protein [Nocardioides sp. GXZ039]|uniref:hypothetical protein n=1 Tax=Nocardioides sp. GXZ039 TaxID=3136018 RepID=UPI0030F41FE5
MSDDSDLWAEVAAVAEAVAAPVPDEIRIVAHDEIRVVDLGRVGGLLPGRRRLFLGSAQLAVLDRDQRLGVIARELALYSTRSGRLRPEIYRARLSLTYEERPPVNARSRWWNRAVGQIRRLGATVCREQEAQAERLASELTSSDSLRSALEVRPVVSLVWPGYVTGQMSSGFHLGIRPAHASRDFGDYFAAMTEDDEADLDAAVAALDAGSGVDTTEAGPYSAPASWSDLELGELLDAADEEWARGTVLEPVALPEFVHQIALDRARHAAAHLYWPIAQAAAVLSWGGARALVERLTGPDASEADMEELATDLLTAALEVAFVDRAGARYHSSWESPVELRDSGGQRLDVRSLVAASAAADAGVAPRKALAAVIADLGLDEVVPNIGPLFAAPVVLKDGFLSLAYIGRSRVFAVTVDALVIARVRTGLRMTEEAILAGVDRAGPEALIATPGARVIRWVEVSEVRWTRWRRRMRVKSALGGIVRLPYTGAPYGDLHEALRLVVGDRLVVGRFLGRTAPRRRRART